MVVCLLSLSELRHLGVKESLEPACKRAELDFIQYPIIEMKAPENFETACELVQRLSDIVRSGRSVVIHCRGGVGRAGMVGACLLLKEGLVQNAKDAIAYVRKKRCKSAVESRSQEQFIAKFATSLSS
mmetsp:Transcript_2605/g.6225  ORF Transcript_2605/g.6225 Transcript_2605/m.6225 type:complete len:128 (-) Transcript_2605:63-446(-)